MNTYKCVYIAIDLHSNHSMVGYMNDNGKYIGQHELRTTPENLIGEIAGIPAERKELVIEQSNMAFAMAQKLRGSTDRLKQVSYVAWETAQKTDNEISGFYRASLERSSNSTNGRLNTQRKILTTLWSSRRMNAHTARRSFTSAMGIPPNNTGSKPLHVALAGALRVAG